MSQQSVDVNINLFDLRYGQVVHSCENCDQVMGFI